MNATTLRDGDVIVVSSKDGGSSEGSGFLASDVLGAFGSSDERLMVAPAVRTASGQWEHPPAFQTRCMFRVDAGYSDGARAREDILYGQPIMLVHVNTGMILTATTKDDVQLQPETHAGCFFVPEPR